MGRRTRRSASNVISTAILEVFIMGLFVIIAQPQLRDALMGILHVHDPAKAVSTSAGSAAEARAAGTFQTSASTNPSALPRLGGNPTGGNASGGESSGALGTVSNLAGMAANALQGLANATAPAGSAPTGSAPVNDPRLASTPNGFSSNAPLEHYESFRVTVPNANAQQAQFDYRQALPSTSNRGTYSNQEVPSLGMVPFGSPVAAPQNYPAATNAYPMTGNGTQGYPVAGYPVASYAQAGYAQSGGIAPFASAASANHAPTQLVPGQWNIASANQSPQPAGGWNVVRPHETSYQEPYPPPYGTQSQWK